MKEATPRRGRPSIHVVALAYRRLQVEPIRVNIIDLLSAVILARTAVMSIRLRLKAEALMRIPLRIEEQRTGPLSKK